MDDDRAISYATPAGRPGERRIPGRWIVWALIGALAILGAGLLALFVPEFMEAASGFR